MDEKEIREYGNGYYWASVKCFVEDGGIESKPKIITIQIDDENSDIQISTFGTTYSVTPDIVVEIIREIQKPDIKKNEQIRRLERAKELIHRVGVDIPLAEAEMDTMSVRSEIQELIKSYKNHWIRFKDMRNPSELSDEEIKKEFEKLNEVYEDG